MSATSVVIAIDGPSASGKSSVSRLVAEALGFRHVDTGSMYRAFTWKVLEEGVDPANRDQILALMRKVRLDCDFVEGERGGLRLRTRLDGVDPGMALRSPQIEQFVSQVAAIPEVRTWLVQVQQNLVQHGDLVVEGRDIGTAVFPDTKFKFYVDADPEVRARRRAKDQKEAGFAKDRPLETVQTAIAERDRKDSTRAASPLKVADDALRIDTSHHTPQDTVDVILKHIRTRHLAES